MKIDLWKIVVGVVVIGVGVVIGMSIMALRNRETLAPIEIIPPEPTATLLPTVTPSPIMVYVSGEVLAPDVYTLAPGSRIKQLVEAAGGFTETADTDAVNLAYPLTDGVHIHIPAEGEPAPTPPGELTDPVPQQVAPELDRGFGGDKININTSGQVELEMLPDIGPITARAILDYRSVNGPFSDISSIMEVPGIGQKTFDKIQDLITTDN